MACAKKQGKARDQFFCFPIYESISQIYPATSIEQATYICTRFHLWSLDANA
jgi:hypothetical protein